MTNISKLVDHILSNACLIEGSGLYHGRAGIALSLFEASGHLMSEEVEEKAFDLFQESLILQSGDLSFENGLSGVGYVLCYLIENKFIDADFDEIFGVRYEKIIKNLSDIEKTPEKLLNSLQVIYFLSTVQKIKPEDERPQKIIKKIFEGLELFFMVQFEDFNDIYYANDKMAVLRLYETYLKLVNFTGYMHFSRSLLENYIGLYRNSKVVSSIVVGYHLGLLSKQNAIKGYNDEIGNHISNGVKNINEDYISLKEKIDVMKLVCDINNNPGLFPDPTIHLEDPMKKMNWNCLSLDYKEGLSRFLIFYVNKQAELL